MKRILLAAVSAFVLAVSFIPAKAQQVPNADNISQAWSLSGSSGNVIYALSNMGSCTFTVDSSANLGGGSLAVKVSANGGGFYQALTGYSDPGSNASSSQTLSVGTSLSFRVVNYDHIEIVLSGATSAAITGWALCTKQVGPGAVPGPAAVNSNDSGILVHTQNNNPAPNAIASSPAMTAATTAPLLSGSTTLYTYVAYIGVLSTAANATNTYNFISGATVVNACDTPETAFNVTLPQAINGTMAGAGNSLTLYGGSGGIASGVYGIIPASQDLVIPPNTPAINLCIVGAGTTVKGIGIALYTTRSYSLGYFMNNLLSGQYVAAVR